MDEYEQKLAELFNVMKSRGYDTFFKGDQNKAIGVLTRHLDCMSRYIDVVYAHESFEGSMTKGGGQDARDELERLNGMRTAAHNAAMDSLNIVNRIFDGYDLAPFIAVESSDNRSDIGEKIAAYVGAMFLGREGLNRSDAAKLAHGLGMDHAERGKMLVKKLEGLSIGS